MIYLYNTAKLYTTAFNLDSSSTLNFRGGDTGFGYINASASATFNGATKFQLMGALEKNNNMSYLILDTPSLQGSSLQVEAVTVYDRICNPLSNSGYTTNIVKVDDKYFLVFWRGK